MLFGSGDNPQEMQLPIHTRRSSAFLSWIPVALAFVTSAAIFTLGIDSVTGKHSPSNPLYPTTTLNTVDAQPALDEGVALSSIFTPQVQHWSSEILRWSDEWDVDPNLIATVMQIESCGHPWVHSSAGAIGLFQVMPFHFGADEEPESPEVNARRGLEYLSKAFTIAEGDIGMALAGYNGGHRMINRPYRSWPEETRRYVHWGSGIFLDAQNGLSSSPHLKDWLSAGGASLCERSRAALEHP